MTKILADTGLRFIAVAPKRGRWEACWCFGLTPEEAFIQIMRTRHVSKRFIQVYLIGPETTVDSNGCMWSPDGMGPIRFHFHFD